MSMKTQAFGTRIFRFIVIATFTSFTISPTAYADMVSTEQLVIQGKTASTKVELMNLLAREEVRSRMIDMGVDLTDVQSRIDGMTDAELSLLYTNLDVLPAGGDALGAILTVLLIFLILDLAGVTDIFPGV